MANIKVLNIREVAHFFDGLEHVLEDEIWTVGMQEGIDISLEEVIERAPEYKGDLKKSIEGPVELTKDGAVAYAGAHAPYSEYVEYPTRPHFVPASIIGEWAQDHGFGYTGLVVTGKAIPFMRKSEGESLMDVGERMRDEAISGMVNVLREYID